MSHVHDYLTSLQPFAIRLGLDRMERALDALGRPERAMRVLHVAGTNGKGSTCAMAARALREAGHRTGLYTSPHLIRFNERIDVDGLSIDDATLWSRISDVRSACPWHDSGSEVERLTYFEFATLLALLHFAEVGVGAAVVEVGLGGRFDATNVVTPTVCAVLPISLEHTETLGGTLDQIAREKAGIMKDGVPVVIAHAQPPEAMAALVDEAARRRSPVTLAPASHDGPVGLQGSHQRGNAAVAAAALRLLDGSGLSVPESAISRGIACATWPGRLETIAGVLLDGAHNCAGAAALAAALGELAPRRPVDLVFGVLADKDHEAILRTLAPKVRAMHLCPPRSPRARPTSEYRALAQSLVGSVDEHGSVADAIRCARRTIPQGGLVCVSGSLYVVGEARSQLLAE